jgi:hypothetical protein
MRNLVSPYVIARDDHDIEVLQCFAPDGVFVSRGWEIVGYDALRDWSSPGGITSKCTPFRWRDWPI